MTRVAQVMAGAANGGAELFFERLCLALQADGEDVLAVIRGDAARAARLRAGGLDPAQLRFGTALDLLTRPRLGGVLRRFAPRVVVAWMNRANQHTPRGDWTLVGRLGGYYDLRYYRRCDHLVGNTRGIVAWLRAQGRDPARTHYLPNFVADFAATARSRRRPAAGRRHAASGPRAAAYGQGLRPRHPCPAAAARCGAGDRRGRPGAAPLQALARREGVAGRVHFLGWRHDAGALLRAADLFVCSSRVEPLGNMVIEAWSAGCPVVAAAAAGPAELLCHGDDGTVVPAEDAAGAGRWHRRAA